MNDLVNEMTKAISSSSTNGAAGQKCAEIAKKYTLKILDSMSHFKDTDGKRVYTNIIKTRMAVQTGEI